MSQRPRIELRPYDPDQVLISLHIPKTAGTSLQQHLEDWFGTGNLHYHYRGWSGEAPERAEPRAGLCVHGHFNRLRGIGALDYYPDARQFAVFVRDPFDRFVSLWRYLHYQVQSGMVVQHFEDAPDFETWLDRRAAAPVLDDPFSWLAQLQATPDPENLAEVFSGRFINVGTVEAFDRSLALLARALGRPAPAQPVHVNAGTGPDGDFSRFRTRHEAAFPLEHEIYALVRDTVNAQPLD